ncbi:hypothetical protein [Actinomadura rudentiformis]|uniref:Uncharacterized protein n=1 Tax=Actinomadura rudentiformis TaxID=359158 RepID=A0A6H9YRF0_9ACTN|nr:hypothetical protein [Actinomadura rudentiformis]KAB2341870.1 hypothetical protein F8566_40545 [Actinomadura rudentiformis]
MSRGGKNITELAEIPFHGSLGEAFHDYGQELFALGHRWAFELGQAANDAEAAMASLKGHPLLFGVDVRARARRVSKRLRRAQNLAYGLSQEGLRFHQAYVQHFINASDKW